MKLVCLGIGRLATERQFERRCVESLQQRKRDAQLLFHCSVPCHSETDLSKLCIVRVKRRGRDTPSVSMLAFWTDGQEWLNKIHRLTLDKSQPLEKIVAPDLLSRLDHKEERQTHDD